MRLVLYTGKGGVGKTTTAAATAVEAARRGYRTLVLSADAAHSLGDVLDTRLAAAPRPVAPRLDAVELDARVEMERHWGSLRDYLSSLFRHQGIDEMVAEELALLPGAEEVATLLAVERFGRGRRYDVLVVDCAPTDSTLRLVTLPDVAHGAMRMILRVQRALSTVVTPLAASVVPMPLPEASVFRDVETLLYKRLRALRRRLLSDQTSVRIVTTCERMVIDEARRAFTDLCLFELACDAIVLNRMLPEAARDEAFFADAFRVQAERREEVERAFAPLPVLPARLQRDEVVGLEALEEHGRALFMDTDPVVRRVEPARIRFERLGSAGSKGRVRYAAHLPLPGARAEDLDVAKVEDELLVRAGGQRRALKLPRRMATLPVCAAVLRAGELRVDFGDPDPSPGPGGAG